MQPAPRQRQARTGARLADRDCVPCRGGVPPLPAAAQRRLSRQLDDGWRVVAGHHLERDWRLPDFSTALAFVDRVGALAEAQGHHPDFEFGWGRVRIKLWTHAIDGLTESDFVLAAKIDRLPAVARRRAAPRRSRAGSRSRS